MDIVKVEEAWGKVVPAMEKMEKGEVITQVELDACKVFLVEIGKIRTFLTDNLLKQTFGRTYKLVDGKYVPHPQGEYVSTQGMFGRTYFVKRNDLIEVDTKHITPFE